MYGGDSWVWQKKDESRISAVEIRLLRSTCEVSRKDRCRNSHVRDRCGLKEDVVTRVETGENKNRAKAASREGGRERRDACAGRTVELLVQFPLVTFSRHGIHISRTAKVDVIASKIERPAAK
ncbi:hypothetical protein EVAR_37157_1 [Eumeta japonica]|uniref:Uncharacterized protein n=1 Tax=Eumeta variegata TaxID=151549 RepID=A0A4C1WJI1_EUMVA|nr:hypothetical protein EVAR_37157_1 [Eumeta japonica]